jgi:hypothetical protein
MQAARAELEAALPLCAGLLWRLVWLPPADAPAGGDAGPLHAVLSLAHCVADGISCVALAGELAEALLRPGAEAAAAAAGGAAWEAAPYEGRLAAPPTPAALAAKDAAEGARYGAGRQWPPAADAGLHAACGLAATELRAAEAAGLAAACRARGTTVNGALVAAVAAAARLVAHEPAATLCVTACLDCRKHCSPPILSAELGCSFDSCTVLFDGDGGDFWSAARSARAQVSAYVARGVFGALAYDEAGVVAAAQGALHVVRHGLPSAYTLFTSNVGVQPAPREVEALWFATNQRSGVCGYVAHVVTAESSGVMAVASSFSQPTWAAMHDAVVRILREKAQEGMQEGM